MDLTGKNCVITGGTSGIGRSTVHQLSRMGANLVFVGRDERRGKRLAEGLRQSSSNGRVAFLKSDLSDQHQVHALAASIAEMFQTIDVLINNAGARYDCYSETADGIERTFATNHLSHFLLTHLLKDQLMKVPAARVISVGSCSHRVVNDPSPWIFDRSNYQRNVAYAKSKLANIMFAYELARRAEGCGLTSNAVDPGIVATNFSRNNGVKSWLKHLVYHGLRRELVLPSQGANTIVYLAGSSEINGITGTYFFRGNKIASSRLSQDKAAASELWTLSCGKTGLEASSFEASRAGLELRLNCC
jgi:NAD(P)-dependent dehydrogenase (short-subunit alcohol dehydrogenase family)